MNQPMPWEAWPVALREAMTHLAPEACCRLLEGCATPQLPAHSVWVRALALVCLRQLPPLWRLHCTNWAKRLRRRSWPTSASAAAPPILGYASEFRPWSGYRGALVLTHDIDTVDCRTALQSVLKEEQRRGMRSTIFLLAAGEYPIDTVWLSELASAGVGMGLHGWDHDAALGSRSRERMQRDLQRAVHCLAPIQPLAFRAPSFSTSPRLMSVLAELGFRYDSSRTVFHPAYRSTAVALPFRVAEAGGTLWEVPVVLEDSLLFRDWQLNVSEALEYSRQIVDLVVGTGGVVTLNIHPSIAARHPVFYPAFLDLCQERADLWCAPLGDVVDLFEAQCVA